MCVLFVGAILDRAVVIDDSWFMESGVVGVWVIDQSGEATVTYTEKKGKSKSDAKYKAKNRAWKKANSAAKEKARTLGKERNYTYFCLLRSIHQHFSPTGISLSSDRLQ
jgi:hypothetical protein